MKPKHTPGPWKNINHVVEAENIVICSCHTYTKLGTIPYKQSEANAKIIAAAPELLEACQEFIKVINRSPTAMEHYGEAIKIAELAIKKATE